MLITIGVIAFVVTLLTSVMIHEWGHFYTARRFGMKATEFFVGFGPRIWSFRRGETEYGIKAIPAGGYVRIVGMTDLEEIDPADEHRVFYRKPAWQRTIVLAAGSFMHFVIAIVLFILAPLAFGDVSKGTATTTVGKVAPCVTANCPPGGKPSPAQTVGLRAGDQILAFDGRPVTSWDQLTSQIRAAGGRRVDLRIQLDGQEMTLSPTLAVRTETNKKDGKTRQYGSLGIHPLHTAPRVGPVEAISGGFAQFGSVTVSTFESLGAIPAAIPKLFGQTFGGAERAAEDLVGPVGIARASGQIFDQEQYTLLGRIGWFTSAMAGINLFIGIFNLLPLLPLDGGHLAVVFFERGRSLVYRALRRPDPGRVDLVKLMPAAYLFLLLIIGLSVLLLAADVVNPINL